MPHISRFNETSLAEADETKSFYEHGYRLLIWKVLKHQPGVVSIIMGAAEVFLEGKIISISVLRYMMNPIWSLPV